MEGKRKTGVRAVKGEGRLYAGIDPAGNPRRPTGAAILDEGLRVRALAGLRSDEEIETFLASWGKRVVSVGLDGPVGLPRGLNRCCFEGERRPASCPCRQPDGLKGREAERAMSRKGIGVFYLTKKAFARSWILRSLDLCNRLSEKGYRVLEVFPYGAKRVLWEEKFRGGEIPPKRTEKGREILRGLLRKEGIRFPGARLPSDHELDALVGAYIAWLHARGRTEACGDPEEGAILLPIPESGPKGG